MRFTPMYQAILVIQALVLLACVASVVMLRRAKRPSKGVILTRQQRFWLAAVNITMRELFVGFLVSAVILALSNDHDEFGLLTCGICFGYFCVAFGTFKVSNWWHDRRKHGRR